MASTNTTLPLPPVSPEVLAFANEQGVRDYLYPVLEMTRRIFPQVTMTVIVEGDPEIANDYHIVIEVDTSGMGVDEMFDARQRWTAEVFQHCPSTHVCVFRIGMV